MLYTAVVANDREEEMITTWYHTWFSTIIVILALELNEHLFQAGNDECAQMISERRQFDLPEYIFLILKLYYILSETVSN